MRSRVVRLARVDRDFGLEATLEELAERKVPGLSAVLVKGGQAGEFKSAGVSNLISGTPATSDTVFLWFSMTKIVTATAVMQLVERGALGLDDPVRRFVPGFPGARAGWPEVLVRHLLSHSAGLANPIPVRGYTWRTSRVAIHASSLRICWTGIRGFASPPARKPFTRTLVTSRWGR
jgi:CubicO group peptidase (beta-lactamase class C family)